MDLPDFSGATWRNSFEKSRRLVVEMGDRGLLRQLHLDAALLYEFNAARKGERRKKPSKRSAAIGKFVRQTAKTFVNSVI
jgi:hypothetical protein